MLFTIHFHRTKYNKYLALLKYIISLKIDKFNYKLRIFKTNKKKFKMDEDWDNDTSAAPKTDANNNIETKVINLLKFIQYKILIK